MGMFDYVKCEVPLPDGWVPPENDQLFQTKDFQCEMVTHTITKEGRLLEEQIDEMHEVPKSERPFPDAAEGSMLELLGSLRAVKSRHDRNFHGILNFYRGDDKEWHEYNAKFTDGLLVSIEVANED